MPPASVMRKCLKKHSRKRIAKGTESLVYISYVIFLKRLSEESSRVASAQGSTRVQNIHIDQVANQVLAEFRG